MIVTDAMVDAACRSWWTGPGSHRGDMRAALIAAIAVSGHDEVVEALVNVRKLISEAASTGFNYMNGDWPERLYLSQQKTSAALSRVKGAQS